MKPRAKFDINSSIKRRKGEGENKRKSEAIERVHITGAVAGLRVGRSLAFSMRSLID